jgi:hypothetical protein
MKLQKEFTNGIIIFIGIALYFLIMEMLGFSKQYLLRVLNVVFVWYGVNRTIKSNMMEGKNGYLTNMLSAGLTAFIGVFLSICGLLALIYAKGGTNYISNLSHDFLFGGNPTVNEYCFSVLFEGLASAVIVVFIAMQYWRGKTVLEA